MAVVGAYLKALQEKRDNADVPGDPKRDMARLLKILAESPSTPYGFESLISRLGTPAPQLRELLGMLADARWVEGQPQNYWRITEEGLRTLPVLSG